MCVCIHACMNAYTHACMFAYIMLQCVAVCRSVLQLRGIICQCPYSNSHISAHTHITDLHIHTFIHRHGRIYMHSSLPCHTHTHICMQQTSFCIYIRPTNINKSIPFRARSRYSTRSCSRTRHSRSNLRTRSGSGNLFRALHVIQ